MYLYRVRTPGGRLVVQYWKKKNVMHRSLPKCMETGKVLHGMVPNRGNYKNRRSKAAQKKRTKHPSRPYGGTLCMPAVRNRILRAFLITEAREVKAKERRRQRELNKLLERKKKKKEKEDTSS